MIEIDKKDAIAIIDFLEVFAEYVEADPQGAKAIARHALLVRQKLIEKYEVAK